MWRRIVITVVALAVWIPLLGAYHERVRRERILELRPRLSDEGQRILRDEWLQLTAQGKPVGHLRVKLIDHPDEGAEMDGYQLLSMASLEMEAMGVRQHLRTESEAIVGGDLTLRRFRYRIDSDMQTILVAGRRTAEGIEMESGSGGNRQRTLLPLAKEELVYIADAARLVLLRDGLTRGATWEINLFDPATQSLAPAKFEVEARENVEHLDRLTPAWRIVQSHRGLYSTLWLSERGEVLREESQTGMLDLVARATTADRALAAGGTDPISAEDLMRATRVFARNAPSAPRKVELMQVRLGGIDLKAFPAHGGTQLRYTPDGAVLELDTGPRPEPPREDDLAVTISMPHNDPALRARARAIAAGASNLEVKAKRIADWVFDSVHKAPRVTFPQATEVLQSMVGDCNEHAVLYGALCRAVDIPARVVAGVVAQPDGYFYFHAWNEVCVDGEHWIEVDTAFGQWPADATHIKLVEGELGDQAALLQAIGRLTIDVVSSRTTS